MLAQRTADVTPTGSYSEFLQVANDANRVATFEQKRLMRHLAAQQPSTQEATAGIRRIMGWDG